MPKPVSPAGPPRPVIAKDVHHVTHIDSTWLKDFLGATADGVTVMFDSFSRFPLAVPRFVGSPEPDAMIRFVEDTFRRFGTPRYLIADRGGEFTAEGFKERIDAWGIVLRFCSAEHHRANAKLERFWRSLKSLLFGLLPPQFQSEDRDLVVNRYDGPLDITGRRAAVRTVSRKARRAWGRRCPHRPRASGGLRHRRRSGSSRAGL